MCEALFGVALLWFLWAIGPTILAGYLIANAGGNDNPALYIFGFVGFGPIILLFAFLYWLGRKQK